jgi:hypothetical protein
MQTTDRGQGIAFEAWEIAAASKLYGETYGVTLDSLLAKRSRSPPLNSRLRRSPRVCSPVFAAVPAASSLRYVFGLGLLSNSAAIPTRVVRHAQQNDFTKIRWILFRHHSFSTALWPIWRPSPGGPKSARLR